MMSFCSLGHAFTTLDARAVQILSTRGIPIPAPDLAKLAHESVSAELGWLPDTEFVEMYRRHLLHAASLAAYAVAWTPAGVASVFHRPAQSRRRYRTERLAALEVGR